MRRFMYYVAERLGLRVHEVEAWPVAELLGWAEYHSQAKKKPEQTPEEMLGAAMRLSRGR